MVNEGILKGDVSQPPPQYGLCVLDIDLTAYAGSVLDRTPVATLSVSPPVRSARVAGKVVAMRERTFVSYQGRFEFWALDGESQDVLPRGWPWNATLKINNQSIASFPFYPNMTRRGNDPLDLSELFTANPTAPTHPTNPNTPAVNIDMNMVDAEVKKVAHISDGNEEPARYWGKNLTGLDVPPTQTYAKWIETSYMDEQGDFVLATNLFYATPEMVAEDISPYLDLPSSPKSNIKLSWVGDQIAFDGVVADDAPHLTGSSGSSDVFDTGWRDVKAANAPNTISFQYLHIRRVGAVVYCAWAIDQASSDWTPSASGWMRGFTPAERNGEKVVGLVSLYGDAAGVLWFGPGGAYGPGAKPTRAQSTMWLTDDPKPTTYPGYPVP